MSRSVVQEGRLSNWMFFFMSMTHVLCSRPVVPRCSRGSKKKANASVQGTPGLPVVLLQAQTGLGARKHPMSRKIVRVRTPCPYGTVRSWGPCALPDRSGLAKEPHGRQGSLTRTRSRFLFFFEPLERRGPYADPDRSGAMSVARPVVQDGRLK